MPHKQLTVVLQGSSSLGGGAALAIEDTGGVGALADLCERLASEHFDIVAIGGADTGPGSGVTLLVEPDEGDDESRLRDILNGRYAYAYADALHLSLPDEPGTLAKVARAFADKNISIDAIVVVDKEGGRAHVALATNNPGRAREIANKIFPDSVLPPD